MRTMKRVGAICAVLGGLAGSVVAFGAPAQAADCPAGQLCLFSGDDGSGTRAVFSWGSPDLRGQGVDNPGWIINNSNVNFCLYEGYNYTGKAASEGTTVSSGFSLHEHPWNSVYAHSVKPC